MRGYQFFYVRFLFIWALCMGDILAWGAAADEEKLKELHRRNQVYKVCEEAESDSAWVKKLFEDSRTRHTRTALDMMILWQGASHTAQDALDAAKKTVVTREFQRRPRRHSEPEREKRASRVSSMNLDEVRSVLRETEGNKEFSDCQLKEIAQDVKKYLESWKEDLGHLVECLPAENPFIEETRVHILNALRLITGVNPPDAETPVSGHILQGIFTKQHQPGYDFERNIPDFNIIFDPEHPYASYRLPAQIMVLLATHGTLKDRASDADPEKQTQMADILEGVFGKEWIQKVSTFVHPVPLVKPWASLGEEIREKIIENPFVSGDRFLYIHNGWAPDGWEVDTYEKPWWACPLSPTSFLTRGAGFPGSFSLGDQNLVALHYHLTLCSNFFNFGEKDKIPGIVQNWEAQKNSIQEKMENDPGMKQANDFLTFYFPDFNPFDIPPGMIWTFTEHHCTKERIAAPDFFRGERREMGVFLGLINGKVPEAVILGVHQTKENNILLTEDKYGGALGSFTVRRVPWFGKYHLNGTLDIVRYAQPALTNTGSAEAGEAAEAEEESSRNPRSLPVRSRSKSMISPSSSDEGEDSIFKQAVKDFHSSFATQSFSLDTRKKDGMKRF